MFFKMCIYEEIVYTKKCICSILAVWLAIAGYSFTIESNNISCKYTIFNIVNSLMFSTFVGVKNPNYLIRVDLNDCKWNEIPNYQLLPFNI